jgi:hypothetical protein
MIRMTDHAATEVEGILTANRTPNDQGVKLVPTDSGGVAMTIDRPQEGDDVVGGEGRPLLIVDAALARRLDRVVFDVAPAEKDEEGPRFVLREQAAL